MKPPEVGEGDWIKFGNGLDGYVLKKFSETVLAVGYFQNHLKAIKENVIWDGARWEFENQKSVGGTYLSGFEERIVKAGPFGR